MFPRFRSFFPYPPPIGIYMIDCQFGKINYVSGEISPVINTRVDACGSYWVIMVDEEDSALE